MLCAKPVIENKLLAALDEEGKVAIIASEADIALIVRAFHLAIGASPSASEQDEFRQYLADVEQLERHAFP